MRQFFLTADRFDILCLAYSNLCTKKNMSLDRPFTVLDKIIIILLRTEI